MESIYKIDTGSDHVAKFRGDRPRELGDLEAKKKKKHHEHFIRPPVTTYGRPNEGCNSCASLAGLVLSFTACFILLVIAPLGLQIQPQLEHRGR